MPMPSGGQWPPPEWEPAYQAFREWHAWYAGDPDLLGEVYVNRTDRSLQPRSRPSQYAGGVYGRLSRWFWGNPSRADQRDPRFHIPAPADIARISSDLLFSEPPTLSVPESKTSTAGQEKPKTPTPVMDRLTALSNDLPTLLLEGAEVQAAMGGVYLRPTVDTDLVPDRAFLTAVHADGALPRFRHGRLVEVTFWTTLGVDGQKHWRLLEHHEPGRIEYALFEGTDAGLGKRVPLTEHPDAEPLAGQVDADSSQVTGLEKRLDVVYVPNIGPQRRWRTINHLRNLGRSDFDGTESLFDRLDEVWSSWMRDIRIGKGRVMVPEVYLQSNGSGQGASFDAEREVFSALNMIPRPDGVGNTITVAQFAIRVQEHKDTADAIWREILRAAGYSEQTMGEDGTVAATATEVVARERRSFTTRDRKLGYWRPGLTDAVELLMAMEKAHRLPAAVEPVRPDISIGDVVMEDPSTLAQTAQFLRAAEAASTRTLVEMMHPHWDTDQIDAEVKAIEEERQAAMPPALEDPGTFTGDDPADSGPVKAPKG